MKRMRLRRFARVIGMAVAASVLLCGSSVMAAFDVNDTNGYDRLIAEVDFEGYAEGATLPTGNSGIGIFDHKGLTDYPPKAVKGPADAIGAANHNMTGRLDAVPDSASDNYIRIRYEAIDPAIDRNVNPSAEFARKYQLVKLEQDILWTSTDIEGNVNYIDYDCENVNGRGVRAYANLLKFGNGTLTVPFNMSDEPNPVTIPYEANRWYHLTFYVNSATGRFSFYLDGELKAENVRCFNDGNPGIMPVGFTTYIYSQSVGTADNPESVYLDNIRYRSLLMEERSYTVKREAFNVDFDENKHSYTKTDPGAIVRNTNCPWPAYASNPVDADAHGNVLRVKTVDKNGKLANAYIRPMPVNLTGDTSDYYADTRITDETKVAEMSKVHISLDLCFSGYVKGNLLYIYVNKTGSTTGFKHRSTGDLAEIGPDGYIKFKTYGSGSALPGQIIAYEPLKWYTFDIYFDLTTNTYTAKVNGETVVENMAMPNDPENIMYLTTFYFQFANTGNATDGWVDIDNYKIDMVDSTAAPKFNRAQFKDGGYYLACFPNTPAEMLYAQYDSTGKSLENCQISRGDANTYHIMEIDESTGGRERVFWWQPDTLVPISNLPALPAQ